MLVVTPGVPALGGEHFRLTQWPFPVLVDARRYVYRRYGVTSRIWSLGQRPGLFVIDRTGLVCYAHVGAQQWNIPRVEEIRDILDGLG